MIPRAIRPRRAALPITGLLLACMTFGCGRHAAPPEKELPAPVETITPRMLIVEEWTELLGTTQPLPDHVARISAPVEGRVLTVLQDATGKPIVEGQWVKKGDVIVRLDASVIQANRDRIAANQAELKEQTKQAGFAVKLADIEVRRLEELGRSGATNGQLLVSRIELEKARVAFEDAKSKQTAAEKKLEAGDKELHALDEQLKLFTLTAPISGRLGRLHIVPGQTLPVGSLVSEVVDLEDEIDVLCFAPPHVARRLKVKEQPARLAADETTPAKGNAGAGNSADLEGKIEFIAEQAEPETGNFAVKLRFANRVLHLRGNTVVRARVLTQPGKACFTIPDAALMEDQDPPAVVIVEDLKTVKNKEGKDEQIGKARKLRAILGVRDRHLHQVELIRLQDPEKKGDVPVEEAMIVVKGAHGLQTDDKVKIEREEEEDEK